MAEAEAWAMIPKLKNGEVTLDMHPIVLCRNCKYGEKTRNWFKEEVVECQNSDLGMMGYCHMPDWFCADGERRAE